MKKTIPALVLAVLTLCLCAFAACGSSPVKEGMTLYDVLSMVQKGEIKSMTLKYQVEELDNGKKTTSGMESFITETMCVAHYYMSEVDVVSGQTLEQAETVQILVYDGEITYVIADEEGKTTYGKRKTENSPKDAMLELLENFNDETYYRCVVKNGVIEVHSVEDGVEEGDIYVLSDFNSTKYTLPQKYENYKEFAVEL